MTETALAAPPRSLSFLASAWGGLAGAIGLMIGLALGSTAQDVVVGIAFVVGGAIAATRAPRRPVLHAVLGAAFGYAIFAAFILLANVISQLGGPDAPEFSESGSQAGVITAVWAVGGCVVGGVAGIWLSPRRPRRR